MMRLIFITCLIFFCQTILAQDTKEDTKTQNQSGPLGLPERKSVPKLNSPVLTSDKTEDEINEDERPDFGFDDADMKVEGFQSDLGLTPESTNKDAATPAEVDNSTSEETVLSESSESSSEKEDEEIQLLKEEEVLPDTILTEEVSTVTSDEEYSWKIIQSEPISIPKTLYFSKKQVRLRVTINPQGEVVKVRGIRKTTPHSVLNYVNQALKAWQFEPPQNFGIDENITKVLVIPLSLR